MDLKNFMSAIAQIAEEKNIPLEKVIESVEAALAVAYKKDYGKKTQIIKAKLDPKTGDVKFWQVKLVVDKDMIYSEEELKKKKESEVQQKEESDEEEKKIRFNPERHIMIEEAKKIKPDIKPGQELEMEINSKMNYGRIAAQTAKQVILQKIKEAERDMIFNEYKSKEGEIASGIIQRIEGRNIYIDIGKTIAVLPKEEQIYGEFYRPGQRLRVYVLKVEETSKGPVVFVSRSYPKFVSKLFELEVPEISQGAVAIKSIAREPGSRTKIAVAALDENIDPIGSVVGQKGTRVMTVINELGGEKIDVIEYSEDPEKFIKNALSPAKIIDVKILPKNRALCIVPEDQLSLAIGKDGQNVRLAAKLTGWKIDVRVEGAEEVEEEIKKETEEEKKEVKEEPESKKDKDEIEKNDEKDKKEEKKKEEKSENEKKEEKENEKEK